MGYKWKKFMPLLSTAAALSAGGFGCIPLVVVDNPNPPVVVDEAQDQTKAVCDPFGSRDYPAAGYDHGIVGRLGYLPDEAPRYTRVTDYATHTTKLEEVLFFGALNVPTRAFDRGFFTLGGSVINNQHGNTLYEYFSLHLESQIRLAAGDNAGNYQFALLADDGAILSADTGNGFEVLVDNDGTHATKMACATIPVRMDQSTKLPIKVDYYQGPRYHISLMLIWREWSDRADFVANDPYCGTSGNSRFFDSTKIPSAPTARWNDLVARGWKVVTPNNYYLPDHVAENPCQSIEPVQTIMSSIAPSEATVSNTSITFNFVSNYENATFQCSVDGATFTACSSPHTISALANGDHVFKVRALDPTGSVDPTGGLTHNWTVDTIAPVISNLTVSGVTNSTATLTWTTSEPTITRVTYGSGGVMSETAEELTLKTSHSITVQGLSPFTVYDYQASGDDSAGNRGYSGIFNFRTLR